MDERQANEWLKCGESVAYFIDTYCKIYDATRKDWIPFELWREQYDTLKAISENRLIVILKARQLGLTWLVLAYILWLMLFKPAATALIFSRRDTEAIYLVDERLKGMFKELPQWMRDNTTDWIIEKDSSHEWHLGNGSNARAFPTTGGDSYTASVALVDEADLSPDLDRLMRSVKPTIDGGGQLILLSRSDKGKPNSAFKRIYRAAKLNLTNWVAVFLPWYVRPGRDAAWYAMQESDILERTGSRDDLHEQYPATDTEALAPRTLDKRIPPNWLEQCYVELKPITPDGAPNIPGLMIYAEPDPGRLYVIGLDPAEGNPTSDDSALEVSDFFTGEEVAMLAGKLQPSTLAAHAYAIGRYYNNANVLPERNNHGHAVILWLQEYSTLQIINGPDGRPGWVSSSLGKAIMYNVAADTFRARGAILHNLETLHQLQSIEGSTLRAPEGEMDDKADAFVLSQVARVLAIETQETEYNPVVIGRGW